MAGQAYALVAPDGRLATGVVLGLAGSFATSISSCRPATEGAMIDAALAHRLLEAVAGTPYAPARVALGIGMCRGEILALRGQRQCGGGQITLR